MSKILLFICCRRKRDSKDSDDDDNEEEEVNAEDVIEKEGDSKLSELNSNDLADFLIKG